MPEENVNDIDFEELMSQGSGYNEVNEASETKERKPKHQKEKGESKLSLKNALIVLGVILVVLLLALAFMIFSNGSDDEPINPDEYYAEEEVTFKYTQEEIELLRLNGYTADEIEENEFLWVDAANLVKEAEDKRKKQYEAEIKPYLDGASEEFKQLKELTWVGGEPLEYSSNVDNYSFYSKVYNADYIKVPAYGNQLWVKVMISDSMNLFMSVTPERYNALNDSGNIVVTVEWTNTGDKNIITNITEVVVE